MRYAAKLSNTPIVPEQFTPKLKQLMLERRFVDLKPFSEQLRSQGFGRRLANLAPDVYQRTESTEIDWQS